MKLVTNIVVLSLVDGPDSYRLVMPADAFQAAFANGHLLCWVGDALRLEETPRDPMDATNLISEMLGYAQNVANQMQQ